jgi:uncharacterized membrane protein HdeD (DUF308 family)
MTKGKGETIMVQAMKKYWWLVLLHGIVAVVFGVYTLLNPGISAVSLVLAFGIYAIASGVINLGMALFGGGESGDRVLLGLSGLLGGLLGGLVLTWPGISMIMLLAAIIAFVFMSGIVEIVAAFQMRDFWLGLSGLISVLFGIYAFRFPGDGALAVVFGIGIYAIAVGVTQIIASFQLRRLGNTLSPSAT